MSDFSLTAIVERDDLSYEQKALVCLLKLSDLWSLRDVVPVAVQTFALLEIAEAIREIDETLLRF